jgi:hypothetical protein
MNDAPSGAAPFDWRIFADATCAGLTALIPLPLVDLVFELYFRRRMPRAIVRTRASHVAPAVIRRLGRKRPARGLLEGCVTLPFVAAKYLVTRLWHKIIYVLAIADASSLISEYWHRAHLIDHMVRAGHLAAGTDVEHAVQCFEEALGNADTSPLRGLARQTVRASRRVFRLLIRARRRGTAAETEPLGEILGSHWGAVRRSFDAVASGYNRIYAEGPGARSGHST